MHSKYLKCDKPGCDSVIDRRAPDDFKSRGVFAVGEHRELIAYAKALGWSIDDDKHFCPKHGGARRDKDGT